MRPPAVPAAPSRRPSCLTVTTDIQGAITFTLQIEPNGVWVSYFQDHRESLYLLGRDEFLGLRGAQTGAAFAVASHFTVKREPAVVSLPTGAGKTAVISVIPFLLSARRVLVVAPSKLLVSQVEHELTHLGTLRRAGVVGDSIPSPRVHAQRTQVRDQAGWTRMLDFDVVVGTPNVLSPARAGVTKPPPGLFDLLVIDEAHHAAAKTYAAIVDEFANVRVALFTATPFRRDRKLLPGSIVYAYPLRLALQDGIFSPITFTGVDLPDGVSGDERDQALIQCAVDRFQSPEHQRVESRLIVRTDTVRHAKELVERYAQAGLRLELITASTSRPAANKAISRIRDEDSSGLVSVGVLGEGFDFPRLKIGVYHRPHSSLPTTLQFLGRISRVLPEAPTAELIAIRRDVSGETADLYDTDGAWADLVPQIADAAVAEEGARRDYLRSFDPLPMQPLSLGALRPRKYVKVYRLTSEQSDDLNFANPIEQLSGGDVIYRGTSSDSRMLVVITEHLDRPEWINADTFDHYSYELHLIVVDRDRRFAFVHGTRDGSIDELMELLGVDEPKLIDPLWFDRLMAGIAVSNYHSVGMRSARAAGGRLAAYRQLAGSNVEGAVSAAESRSYGTGHAIAQVRDPMRVTAKMIEEGTSPAGARVTSMGLSYGRARIFAPDLAELVAFRNWCDRLVELADSRADENPSGLPNLTLHSPRSFEEFTADPYAVVMDPHVFSEGFILTTPDGRQIPFFNCELSLESWSATALVVALSADGEQLWRGELNVDGAASTVSGLCDVLLPGHGDAVEFGRFLTGQPPFVFYADGSSTIGHVMFQPRPDYPDLGADVIEPWSFQGVHIRTESKKAPEGFSNIKDHVAELYSADESVVYVVDDDRAQEVADLVVISERSSGSLVAYQIRLIHCKFSCEDRPGYRVEDLYEVAGQAARSVRWCDLASLAKQLTRRIGGGSKILKGDHGRLLALLDSWATRPVACDFEIRVVQPGLLTEKINAKPNIKIMLSDVLEWTSQHDVSFKVTGTIAIE